MSLGDQFSLDEACTCTLYLPACESRFLSPVFLLGALFPLPQSACPYSHELCLILHSIVFFFFNFPPAYTQSAYVWLSLSSV